MIKMVPSFSVLRYKFDKMDNNALSATDRKILAALRADARMSITELAAATGTSRATAKTRLEALKESGRIRRFTIETDVDVEGEVKAITLIELQGKMSRAVIRTISKIPEVSTIYSTNGAWDLVVEIKTDTTAVASTTPSVVFQ